MLNDSQRQMVESSIWVVNTALKKQGLEGDKDLKQEALLCMCQCAERFDVSKGVKWTTYAYRNVYLCIKRVHAKEKKKTTPLLNQDLFDMSEQLFEDEKMSQEENNSYKMRRVMTICTPTEKQFLMAKLKDCTNLEIAHQMNCSKSKIDITMKNIKEKVKSIDI